jgi:hypothetical protein
VVSETQFRFYGYLLFKKSMVCMDSEFLLNVATSSRPRVCLTAISDLIFPNTCPPDSKKGTDSAGLSISYVLDYTLYRLLPTSHVAHGVVHEGSPGPPGRSSVRKSMSSPAVHPPNSAVTVTYILSFAAAVIARSAPPGIADHLNTQVKGVISETRD